MRVAVIILSEAEAFAAKITALMEEQGNDVFRFCSYTDVSWPYAAGHYSLTVLVVKELDENIIEIIGLINKLSNAPMFVCYEMASEDQRIVATNRGATICVSRECSVRECFAIMDALIRVYNTIPEIEGREVLVLKNGLVINTLNWSVWLNRRPIRLTRREYLALRFLAQNRNRVLSRKEIYCAAWQTKEDYEIDESVKTLIKSLRKKLGDSEYQIIQNIRGVGYRLKDEE